MAITKTQQPYEFLVRFDKDGKLAGAHIQFRTFVIDEDGTTVLSEKVGDAQPVEMAGQTGFPLADVLADVQAAALAKCDELQVALTTSEGRTRALQDELNKANAALTEACDKLATIAATAATVPAPAA